MDGGATARVADLLAASRQAGERADHRLGRELADSALQSAARTEDAAEALTLRAGHLMRLGEHEASVEDGDRALALYASLGDPRGQIEVRVTLVMAYNLLGLHHPAMDQANAALAEASLLGDPRLCSLAFNRAGISADGLGDGARAIELLEQALALAGPAVSPERCSALINLASVARSNVDRCRERGDADGARAAAERSLSWAGEALRTARNPLHEASACSVAAAALVALDRLDEAEPMVRRFRALGVAHGYPPFVADADLELARLLHLRHRHREALEALDGAATLREPENARAACQLAYDCHKALGEAEGALDALERRVAIEARQRREQADVRSRLLLREVEVARARAEADEQRRLALDRASALAESIEQLRQEVEVRRRAEQAAQAANRAKSVFLATMSHELRTPLNAVIGYTEIVREELADPDQSEDLGKVLASARHLLQLIDDLLDLSRLESGRLAFAFAEEPLDVVVRDALALVAPDAARIGLTLRADVAPGLRIRTDAARLRQVLANLLFNAVKFTERGEVAVSARVAGDAVVVAVADTGIGIAPEVLATLFGRFVQADGTPTRRHGGTGLGLALVRELVDRLGGSVTVASQLGAGSTFEVRLPGPLP